MAGVIEVIYLYANTMGMFILSLDNIPFFDAPFSVLDVYIAIMVFELLSWFIIRFITAQNMESGNLFENEGAKYQQYGETVYTSATADDIDFSESIEHE